MNVYRRAANAVKEALIASLKDDLDVVTQGDLWRHYQGMNVIAKQYTEPEKIEYNFSSMVMNSYDPDYNINYVGGLYGSASNDTISLDSISKEVVTFS